VIHRHPRLTVMLDGSAPEDDAIRGITLTDISDEGLMASEAGHLIPGAQVLLEVPLVGWREAEIRWIAGNRAGCRFAEPLSLDELRLAAVSSKRLAGECPALAEAIANMPPLERPSPEVSAPAAPGRLWQVGPAALVALGAASFAAANWLLNHLG
jgi:hypothetical protein